LVDSVNAVTLDQDAARGLTSPTFGNRALHRRHCTAEGHAPGVEKSISSKPGVFSKPLNKVLAFSDPR
jgi:hypothetical protein